MQLTRTPAKSVLRQRLQRGVASSPEKPLIFYSGGDVAQINDHTGSHWSDVIAGRVHGPEGSWFLKVMPRHDHITTSSAEDCGAFI